MATNLSFYIVDRRAVPGSADMSRCYKAADGRYVVDSRTLKHIGLLPDGSGNPRGIERISRNEALTLIARGGYQTGTASNQSQNKDEQL